MRPVLLDMDGFGSFREPTTVDFRGVDYFALVGPTGAGKSTVIDALTFALYGSVPRWDDRRAVAQALAPTATRGTVRLVFDVAGRRYVVARELRRAASGSVGVRNARLEAVNDPSTVDGPGESLAADSAVTPAVEELLGLSYEHFKTCVVLPQGDFAEFLHERPARRQEILVKLLGLEVYQRIGQAANLEASGHGSRAEALTEQLAGFADAGAAAETAARTRVAQLKALDLAPLLTELAAAAAGVTTAERAAAALRAEQAALRALAVPSGLSELDKRHQAAAAALRRARSGAAAAETADTAARAGIAAAPDRAPLQHVARAWAELGVLTERLPAARAAHERDAAALAARERALHDGEAGLAAARGALAGAQRADLAAALRPHLAVGDDCPVCAQPVQVLPAPLPGADLAAAERAVRTAETGVDRHRKAWQAAVGAEQRTGTALETLTGQVEAIRSALDGADDADTIHKRLSEVDELEVARVAADSRLRSARDALRTAERADEVLRAETSGAWTALYRTRDGLVGLGAPPLDRGDLVAAWTLLAAWAAQNAAQREKDQPAAEQAVAAGRAAVVAAGGALAAALDEAGVRPQAGRALVDAAEPAVAVARERADAALREVRRRRREAAALEQRRAEAVQAQRVARSLGQLLRADGFQRWLLGAALDALVAEASRTLADLSGGQFTLGHDGSDFLVVDHFDAGSRRPVKTLSGGETFQASLSLALALSSQLAGLAAAGAARLDSIFLDEGFGTLDEATLETVAATLENLAAGGDRMVGVVTHVPGLAERVPVRFAVRRDQRTSSVSREDS
jgi:DNA repair protein SbcC/Rad50